MKRNPVASTFCFGREITVLSILGTCFMEKLLVCWAVGAWLWWAVEGCRMKNLGLCSRTHLLGNTANPASTCDCPLEFTCNATSNTRMNPLGFLILAQERSNTKKKALTIGLGKRCWVFFLFFGYCKWLWYSLRCNTVLQYLCCALLFFPGLSEIITVQADLALKAGIRFLSSSAVVRIGQILNNSQI